MERPSHPRRSVLTEAEAARVADVFLEHQQFILNVARQFAHDQEDVPDIVQSVGVKVCQHLNGFRGQSELRTWLYRVTVNVARDTFRRARVAGQAIDALAQANLPDIVEDPDHVVLSGERLDALRESVERLRPIYRDAVHHRIRNETEGVTVQDIGEGTARSRLSKACKQLREQLIDDPRFRRDRS